MSKIFRSVTSIFSPPSMPALPPPPPPPAPVAVPTAEENAANLVAAKEQERKQRISQRGRAATMLTGGQGVAGDDSSGIATKKLLGG